MAMFGVWVGAYMTWFRPTYYAPALAGLAAFLVCAAGNIVNDLVDIKTDRVNRPDRVLVRGSLSRRYALVLSIVFNVLALVLAVAISIPMTIVAAVTIALLYGYNYRFKRIPLLGNLVISLLAGLTFITGGVAVDYYVTFYLPGPMIAAMFAFLFHMVREIVKDVQDIEGDRAAGIKTLPQVIGEQRSLLWALVFFFLMVVTTVVPVVYGWFGGYYKIIAIYIVDLPLLAFMIFLWGNPSRSMLRVASTALKIGMALGIFALCLA